jgi:hypothetical protein
MKYVLILKTGKVMVFSIKAVAELYQENNKGSTLVATFPTADNIARIKETYYG